MDIDGGRRRNDMEGSHVVYRLFVPASKAGPIIGKEGSNIKALREETRARIKISTPANRGEDRVVAISTKDLGDAQNPAEAAFLRVYPQAMETAGEDESQGSLRLLIAASQAGALIGRGGATIKAIREGSGATIRITEGAPGLTPAAGDRICQLSGKVNTIEAAVTSIIGILNNNPAHETLEELEGGMPGFPQHHHQPHQQGMAAQAAAAAAAFAAQHTILATQGGAAWPYGATLGGGGGGGGEDSYASRGGGVGPVMVGGVGGGQALRTELRVPSSAVGAILGRGGTTINNIRQVSGATIKVRDSEPGATERSVEIFGSSSQVATAQGLIQAYVAQAGQQ